jgi:hypothetical protein
MSRSLYVSGRTCLSSSIFIATECEAEILLAAGTIQYGFDGCDAHLASETGQQRLCWSLVWHVRSTSNS